MEELHEFKYKVALKKVVDALRREEEGSATKEDLSRAHTSKKSSAKTTSQTKRGEEPQTSTRRSEEISTQPGLQSPTREERAPQPSTSKLEERAGPEASLKRPSCVGIGTTFSKRSKTANGYETIQVQKGKENEDLGFWMIYLDLDTSWDFWDRIKKVHEKQLIPEDVYKIRFRFGGNTETDIIFVFLQIDCLWEKEAENQEKITLIGKQILDLMQFKPQKCANPKQPFIYYKHSGANQVVYRQSYL